MDETLTETFPEEKLTFEPKEPKKSQAKFMNQPVWQSMLIFLVPLLLSNALQSVGQLVGSIVVGRWLGVTALAAISAFFPLFFLLVSFTIGIGSGSSILIGQAYGARNEERMKAIVGTTLTFTFILGFLLAVIGGIFTRNILNLIGTPANIIDVSVHYARILFWSMPVMFLYFAYTTFMRGTGDSRTPFYSLIVSTLLNLFLLPFLIFGWLGIPRFGIYGAAYASVISTVLTFVLMLIYLSKTKHPLQFDTSVRQHLRLDFGLLKLLLRLGIPSSISMIVVSLSEIAVIAFVNRFGSDATAAYGAVNQVVSYVQMPAVSLAIAVSIFASQSIGAGLFDRLKDVIKAGLVLNYIIGGTLIILVYIFSQDILSWFIASKNTLYIAHSLLMITLWSYLIFGHAQIVAATMRASGTVLWPTIMVVFSIWCIEVPVAYLLSHHSSLGILGIWVGYPAAFIASLFLQYSYYRWFWKKKRITRLIR
ncbi:MATE efflux family protein [Desulfofarcimen acetoxidans DSM 771]|uniref:MATE efflux family protein n=1 Tax=Desulfofarcimen acetoxidans (strain ATCC 49208 / DSM 771 / KCTC 5769 / VKM B-1644 / 5575) TaxID=485916 RepID=C8W562_DESAS|nr:MATE family efflux transporter [Desulfofarcimen acetoxidans]ACV62044.1 MATE efflux family protein [Desulfofarcimen acetoxidans DSM 771]